MKESIDVKCKQLIDEFYKVWEAGGGVNFPPVRQFVEWLKKDKSDDASVCMQLLDEFNKSDSRNLNPNLKLDEHCLATFMSWLRKKIAAPKKAAEKDWVGNFLEA